jgi:selenocysteine lyase/cysteine desulfurase
MFMVTVSVISFGKAVICPHKGFVMMTGECTNIKKLSYFWSILMIKSQRDLFDIPEDVAYFNCAFTSPLLQAARHAGEAALQQKAGPWRLTPEHFFTSVETARSLFAELIGCPSDHVAIIPAVSYGLSLAASNLPLTAGQSILVLEEQFPSNVYVWQRLAEKQGAAIKTIYRPADSCWTPAILEQIDSQTAIVALPHCHWTDGTLIDLVEVGRQCRAAGAALVVDATQSLGAMPFPINDIQPDFLITAGHKWLLGPYSFGFCYVASKWLDGAPLEENWLNRAGSEDFSRLVDYNHNYQPGARRYDVGEVSNFILSPIASMALRQIRTWGIDQIATTLQAKTNAIAEKALALGFNVAPAHARSPHMIGISKTEGLGKKVLPVLAENKIYVSIRGDAIRIAPHLYNSEADLERLIAVLHKI